MCSATLDEDRIIVVGGCGLSEKKYPIIPVNNMEMIDIEQIKLGTKPESQELFVGD